MADLTFQQSVSNIIGMKGEIVRSSVEMFVIVGLSTTFAVVFCTLLGVLLFVACSRQLHYNKPVNFLLDNVVNLMLAFPFVILMIAMIPATRTIVGSTIGPVATSLVFSVSGLFYFARLVELNLREVPKGVIEAAAAMGAPPIAIVCKVLLNQARAGMVSSITVLAIGLLVIQRGGRDDRRRRLGRPRHPLRLLPLPNRSHRLHRRPPRAAGHPDSKRWQRIGAEIG